MRVGHITLKAEAAHRWEADQHLKMPGDSVIVRRRHLRSLAVACPDGCGENLTINLDPAAGPAWRLYQRRRGLTLFPSVWRDTGCGSHFIIWNDKIIWCDQEDDLGELRHSRSTESRVLSVLKPDRFQNVADIADMLDEMPWDIDQACRELTRKGLIIREAPRAHSYRLKSRT